MTPDTRGPARTAHRDVIVVGSGPAGYTAALYLARADLHPLVFEGSQYGGALMNTTDVENYPGFPGGIMGPELMTQIREQADKFGAELVSDDVVAVDLTGSVKIVRTHDAEYTADAVVLAMGSASWCATCDGFFFRDHDIAVVGGGDSAVEEATFLSRFARSVTIVHRRDSLRASRIMAERAENDPKISFAWNQQVDTIEGDGTLTGVTLRSTTDGTTTPLPVTGLIIAVGHDPRSDLVRGQVHLDENGYVLTEANTTRTNVPGVFAAGDLVDHNYMQAITAAGSGCQAALDAERFLASRADLLDSATDAAVV
jgi:thioredoxin reductase (NADPH)